jgi:sugar lactone lactonase YvrE
MFNRQPLGPGNVPARHASVVVASLLLALAASTPARAVTSFSVDGQSPPYTFVQGETYTLRMDVGKPGGAVNFRFARDLNGSGKYDPTAPTIGGTGSFTDGSGQDTDPTPGKMALPFKVAPTGAAGPYVLDLEDVTDKTTLVVPGITFAPKPEPQVVSGHVAVVTAANPTGTPPPDAIVWAYDATQQPVANTNLRPDGSYTLPLPPGTYVLFAEWFGNLHSQRQSVTLAASQQRSGVDIALLPGQEVAGTVRVGDQRASDVLVQASSATGTAEQSTHTLADGSFVLVLPVGQHQITAAGMTETVTVANGPVDGVDFPPAAAGPPPGPGTIVTVAGNGISGYGGDGRPATTARVQALQSVAVDRAGNLYLSTNGSNRVRRVDAATGIITTIAGNTPFELIRSLQPGVGTGGYGGDGGPATQALFNLPQHLALDRAGNLYISDLLNHRIRKVDAVTGIITTVVGTGTEGFAGDGGPATQAQIAGPQAMAFDVAGNLYVSDGRNRRVRKVDTNGTITTVAGGGTDPVKDGVQGTTVALGAPRTLATDAAGNLFIGDGSLNRIFKMSPAGILVTVAGNGTGGFSGDGGPALQARFSAPFPRLTVDSAGNLFFADSNNYRIRKVNPDGIISTVAGSGPIYPEPGSYAGDGGPATQARLWGPSSVTIDAAGNLIFADQVNNRVRKVIGVAAPGLIAGQ